MKKVFLLFFVFGLYSCVENWNDNGGGIKKDISIESSINPQKDLSKINTDKNIGNWDDNGFSLIKKALSPDTRQRFELYSKWERCGCHASECKVKIIDNNTNKLLKVYNSRRSWPCDILATDWEPVTWFHNNLLVVNDGFADSWIYYNEYKVYNIKQDKIDQVIWEHHANNHATPSINTIEFYNTKYFFDLKNNKILSIYEVLDDDFEVVDYDTEDFSIDYSQLLKKTSLELDRIELNWNFSIIDDYNWIFFNIWVNKYEFDGDNIIHIK
jgi:hypothetical protein